MSYVVDYVEASLIMDVFMFYVAFFSAGVAVGFASAYTLFKKYMERDIEYLRSIIQKFEKEYY